MVNPVVFRQYDIRGVVGRDLDPEFARQLGRAFGTKVQRQSSGPVRIALGHDNRLSSEALADGFRRGLLETGVDVVDVGLVPTPALYFAGAFLGTTAAAQITGSHNPPEYNGFKLSIGNRSLYGEAIQDLRRTIDAGDFNTGTGTVVEEAILPAYIDFLSRRFQVTRPLRVVVDCGNGTGSVVAVELLRALGSSIEVIPIFCESDGSFPNHHPDPVVDENLVDLQAKVRETGADLGIAFDGDADRLGAVDELGRIVRGDILLLLFALDLIQRRGAGQKVVFDVKCSQVLSDVITEAGGIPLMSATGHSLIKERMKNEGALLAGELSGHICFAEDYFGFDDALFAACLLVTIVAGLDGPLSERVAEFPRFVSTPEIRYPADERTKFDVVKRAVAHFSKTHKVIDVDGARVLFDEGWGLIRASNTEPVLVARYEAKTDQALEKIRSTIEGWLGGEESVTAS
ncbi:MAG: phosphomannomutase/phosphoglucomutase [Gemmatimonadota bacterium]|jgi:phosphomannomutase/phosphoglucomutase|nr:phosphomannomutase/phosphoglucomutase [Gemmatimonadota bacterium]